jgi:hypothetical protein
MIVLWQFHLCPCLDETTTERKHSPGLILKTKQQKKKLYSLQEIHETSELFAVSIILKQIENQLHSQPYCFGIRKPQLLAHAKPTQRNVRTKEEIKLGMCKLFSTFC